MSFKRIAGLLAIFLACGFGTAFAELEDGDKELGLTFMYEHFEGDFVGVDLMLLDGKLGFMLTDNHEVGGILQYVDVDFEGIGGDAGGVGAFYYYNFAANGMITPYVGAQGVFYFGDLSDAFDYSAALEGGIRVMPGEKASLNIGAHYRMLFGADFIPDVDNYGINAGVSLFF